MQQLREKVLNYLISQDDQAQFYEYKYFINTFVSKNDQDKEFLIRVQQRYFTHQCAGLCFGTYILFAYRRMLSGGVLHITTKLMIDMSVLSLSIFLASKIGVTSAMRDLLPIRRQLLKTTDTDYLRHLLAKYHKFAFLRENEFLIYQDVFSVAEFKEWKQEHQFDITKFGN